jgi:hypothetical protein
MRRFVIFLDADSQARRYVREMEHNWNQAHKKWFDCCHEMRRKLSDLECRARAIGATLDAAIENSIQVLDANAFDSSKHILIRVREPEWYQPWANLTDNLDLDSLHIEGPHQTQTGHMISHVLSIGRTLARLAQAVGMEQQSISELGAETEGLWRQYRSTQWRVKNNWMSSGIHALEQLQIAVRIMDGDIFVDPGYLTRPKIEPLLPWIILMLMYVPDSQEKDQLEWWLQQPETTNKSFEKDLEPLIRSYLHQVYAELRFLATSRLAHQHLVERYKARCENYDWKYLAELIQRHAKRVGKKAKSRQKQPRYEFEDLLTLHFASYLHDNGYAVHYRLRGGVHEPDLLANLANELEPIVVEAKVVSQTYGTARGKQWIIEGLRSLLAYVEKCHSDYGVTNGYLLVFRMGSRTSPKFTFDQPEWVIGQFTIVPKVINIGQINKNSPSVVITREDFLQE